MLRKALGWEKARREVRVWRDPAGAHPNALHLQLPPAPSTGDDTSHFAMTLIASQSLIMCFW